MIIVRFLHLIILCWAMLGITSCSEKNKLTRTYKVKEVVSATELKLRNGTRITLAGLKVPEEFTVKTKKRLEELVLQRLIILIPTETNSSSCIVCTWGYALNRDFLPAEKRHFTDVNAGFMNVQKGTALNVNAVLVREGYARVDTNAFDMLDKGIIELEKRAREDHLGVWKQ